MRRGTRRHSIHRKRRARQVYRGPQLELRTLGQWFYAHRSVLSLAGHCALTVVGIVHLAAFLLVPGGQNISFGWDLRESWPHLTFFRSANAFGFPTAEMGLGFVTFQIYEQDGGIREGVFPSPGVQPELRFDRWAAAGDAVSGDAPELHERLLAYLLENLPASPLRVELFTGRWQEPAGPPEAPRASRESVQQRVGNHDGLTRGWDTPGSEREPQ